MNLVLRQFSPSRALAALSFVVVLTLTAHAGPPLICFPYSIGDAKCLPGGRDVFGTAKSYDRKNLLADTLALLSRDTPIIIRMETLRRALRHRRSGRQSVQTADQRRRDGSGVPPPAETPRTHAGRDAR